MSFSARLLLRVPQRAEPQRTFFEGSERSQRGLLRDQRSPFQLGLHPQLTNSLRFLIQTCLINILNLRRYSKSHNKRAPKNIGTYDFGR